MKVNQRKSFSTKALTLLLAVSILLTAMVSATNKKTIANASNADTIYYITDSRFVSVYDGVQSTFTKYCYLIYDCLALDSLFYSLADTSVTDPTWQYDAIGPAMDLFDGSYAENVVSNWNYSSALDVGNCQVVFEFVYLLPNIANLSEIFERLQLLGCHITLIGAFIPNDYENSEWMTLMSYVTNFVTKLPDYGFIGYTLDYMYDENQTLDDTVILIEGDHFIDMCLYEKSFIDVYKYSWFVRELCYKIKDLYQEDYVEGYYAEDMLAHHNIVLLIHDPSYPENITANFYDLNSQTNTLYSDDEDFGAGIQTFDSDYEYYTIIGMTNYGFESDFYDLSNYLLLNQSIDYDLFILPVVPCPLQNTNDIHVYGFPAGPITMDQYYDGEYVYVGIDDPYIWQLIVNAMATI
ncbi:MAG: hypothetical protein IJ811_02545 [Clostridia bacterium]|nr:hypothetical protein [Clostridia bacterium]